MRITKHQLRKIIKEEKAKLTADEFYAKQDAHRNKLIGGEIDDYGDDEIVQKIRGIVNELMRLYAPPEDMNDEVFRALEQILSLTDTGWGNKV